MNQSDASIGVGFYEVLFENSVNAILITTPQGKILKANTYFKELFGYSNSDIVHKTLDIISPALLKVFKELKGGKNDIVIQGKNQSKICCEIRSMAVEFNSSEFSAIFIKDVTDLKKTENELQTSNKRFKSLVENAAEALFMHDFNGDFIDVNKQACESLGYTREELLSMNVMDIEEDFSLEDAQKEWSKIEVGNPFTLSGHQKRKNGEVFPVEIRFAVMEIEGERIYMGLVRDITERKEAEEEIRAGEMKYRNALDHMMEGCQIIDYEWNYIYLNDKAIEHSRFKKEDLIKHNMMEVYPGIENTEMFKTLENSMIERVSSQLENEFVFPDETKRWFELSVHPVPEGLFILSIDITDRKNAENELRESKEFQEKIINSMKDGFSALDTNGVHLDVNQAMCDMTGYEPGELIGKGIPHPYWPEEEYTNIQKSLDSIFDGKLDEAEMIFKRKNGERFPVIASPSLIKDDEGNLITVFGTFKDITERKNFENELKKSEERFKTVADFTYDWEYWVGPGGNFLYVSPSCKRISGYSPEEFMKDPQLMKKIIHYDDIKIMDKHQNIVSLGETVDEIEFRIITKKGEIKWIDHRCQQIYNEKGEFLGTRGTNRDITESKKTEEVALRWEGIFENAKFGLALVDASNNHFLEVNTAYADQRGYSPDELIDKPVHEVYPSKYRERLDHIFAEIDKKGHLIFETINMRKDGTTFPVLIELTVFRDEQGKPKTRVAYALDITERKKIESKLEASEEKFRELFDSANDMITLNKMKNNGLPGKFIEVNKLGLERLGYNKDELLKLTPLDIIAPEARGQVPKNAENIQKQGYARYEIIHLTKNGERIPIEVNNHVFELNGEEVALAISRDISERIKSENALKESESKYKGLFDKSSSYLILVSNEGKLMDVNDIAVNFTGQSKRELIGQHFSKLKLMVPEEIPLHIENVSKVLRGEKVKPYEAKAIDKKGRVHYVINNLNPLKKDEEVVAFQVICNDVTDLKIAENKIRKSLNEKEVLLQEIHHRVKNNMQIISSLLNLQSYAVEEEETKDILKDSQGRIKAMSMVHEKLYQSTDLSHINFKDYVEKLVYDLFFSYEVSNGSIKPIFQIEDVELNMETTIPLGLIINELVTNSLKFAFPEAKGTVTVRLFSEDVENVLIVEDDGIGFSEMPDMDKITSLGLQLVYSLVKQLDGTIDLDCSHGTKFTIKFQEMEYKERI